MVAGTEGSGLRVVRLAIVAISIAIVAALAKWSGWWVLLLPAVIIAYAAFAVATAAAKGAAATQAFRARHPGKDLLLVYSDNPQWNDHIANGWLPRWGARAVVVRLPVHQASADQSAPLSLFRSVAGKREHNPIAIVVPPAGRIRVIRFRRAFQEKAAGNDRALREAEERLGLALGKPAVEQEQVPTL